MSETTSFPNIRISSWSELRRTLAGPNYKSWAFRGQANAQWSMFSTLSRYLLNFHVDPRAWTQQEHRILRIFRRKAYRFLQHPPAEGDSFQWLALMQHHGAPTRLLDFTWSPYVAAFFALERATADAAIWAVFPPRLHNRMIRTIRASQQVDEDEVGPWIEGNYEKNFLTNEQALLIVGEPHRMNQRLIAQSGTFVMPGLLDRPVEEIASADSVVKFTLDTAGLRDEAMAELYSMNISNATLFPDLDGLSRSLAYELEFHWAFNPKTMDRREGFPVE